MYHEWKRYVTDWNDISEAFSRCDICETRCNRLSVSVFRFMPLASRLQRYRCDAAGTLKKLVVRLAPGVLADQCPTAVAS